MIADESSMTEERHLGIKGDVKVRLTIRNENYMCQVSLVNKTNLKQVQTNIRINLPVRYTRIGFASEQGRQWCTLMDLGGKPYWCEVTQNSDTAIVHTSNLGERDTSQMWRKNPKKPFTCGT